jgi:hypothetical protein
MRRALMQQLSLLLLLVVLLLPLSSHAQQQRFVPPALSSALEKHAAALRGRTAAAVPLPPPANASLDSSSSSLQQQWQQQRHLLAPAAEPDAGAEAAGEKPEKDPRFANLTVGNATAARENALRAALLDGYEKGTFPYVSVLGVSMHSFSVVWTLVVLWWDPKVPGSSGQADRSCCCCVACDGAEFTMFSSVSKRPQEVGWGGLAVCSCREGWCNRQAGRPDCADRHQTMGVCFKQQGHITGCALTHPLLFTAPHLQQAEFGPADVLVNLALHKILGVDLYGGTLKLSVWLRVEWHDPRLAWDAKKWNVTKMWFMNPQQGDTELWEVRASGGRRVCWLGLSACSRLGWASAGCCTLTLIAKQCCGDSCTQLHRLTHTRCFAVSTAAATIPHSRT